MKRGLKTVLCTLLLATAAVAQAPVPRRIVAGPTKPATCTGGPASGTGAADVWIDTTTASAPAGYVCASSPPNTWVAIASSGSGITSINSDTTAAQTIVTGTAGTDFAVATAAGVTTLKLPTASATNRGALASADFTTFNNKPSINATTNTLPKRTSATAMGDSLLSDDGTVITAAGPVRGIPAGSACSGLSFGTAAAGVGLVVTSANILVCSGNTLLATFSGSDGVLSSPFNVKYKRLFANQGTAQSSGQVALSGWGTGAAVSAVSGFDQSLTFTVTAGTTPSANPTATVTFADGTWTTSPGCQTVQTGGNDIVADVTQTLSATAPVLTWNGTPTNAKTYILTMNCGGR